MFTLDQLRSFIAVAEHLHFGRAAQELRLTQPPLSRQIQKLESEIGAPLFVRGTRQVRLTPVGELFLDRARQVVALSERSLQAATAAARGDEGSLTLGFTAASAVSVLGPLVARLRAELPLVEIDLIEQVSSEQLDGIENGSIDIGLMRTPTRGMPHLRLLREDLVVALPASHPLAALAGPVSLDDLVDQPMIGYTEQGAGYFYRRVERLVEGRSIATPFRVTQILGMLGLVASGVGFALVPRSAVHAGVPGIVAREISTATIDAEAIRTELHAVWSAEVINPVVPRVLAVLEANPLT